MKLNFMLVMATLPIIVPQQALSSWIIPAQQKQYVCERNIKVETVNRGKHEKNDWERIVLYADGKLLTMTIAGWDVDGAGTYYISEGKIYKDERYAWTLNGQHGVLIYLGKEKMVEGERVLKDCLESKTE